MPAGLRPWPPGTEPCTDPPREFPPPPGPSRYVAAVANAVVLGALLLCFATFLTTHVAIAVRLLVASKPRYRGVVALIVLPLAPMWAYRERWRKLAWLWILSMISYGILVATASFLPS